MSENKKYRLTRKSITLNNGMKLYQIKALKNFDDVEKGQLGGYVQGEHNLSHEGLCWIYNQAKVYNQARIEKDAKIYDEVSVYDYAIISDCAHIYHHVNIHEHAHIYDYTLLCDHVCVKAHATLNCHAHITKNAIIKDTHDFYTGYLDSRCASLHRKEITLYYTAKHEVRVVYQNKTYNLQGFIEEVRHNLGYIVYAEDFRPQLVNARRRMYFKDMI